MGFRRRRKRPRVHWVDTHVDLQPQSLSQYNIALDNPATGFVALSAFKLLVKRQPQAVEEISSILEGKDEGFRCRRIVGQLRLETPQVQENESFDTFTASIWVGIAVMKIRDDGTPMVTDGADYTMAPWQQADNSESWMFKRVYQWRCNTGTDLSGLTIRDNTFMQPFGDFVDVTVNRRVAPDEDIILLTGWDIDHSIEGTTRTYPRIMRNLRMLISR